MMKRINLFPMAPLVRSRGPDEKATRRRDAARHRAPFSFSSGLRKFERPERAKIAAMARSLLETVVTI
jgi:hypothetical protein